MNFPIQVPGSTFVGKYQCIMQSSCFIYIFPTTGRNWAPLVVEEFCFLIPEWRNLGLLYYILNIDTNTLVIRDLDVPGQILPVQKQCPTINTIGMEVDSFNFNYSLRRWVNFCLTWFETKGHEGLIYCRVAINLKYIQYFLMIDFLKPLWLLCIWNLIRLIKIKDIQWFCD